MRETYKFPPGRNKRVRIGLIFRQLSLFCILFLSCIVVSAFSQKRHVSLKLEDVTIEELFEHIKQANGYKFVYRSDLFAGQDLLDLEVEEKPVSQILDEVLKPKGYDYELMDDVIIIRRVPEQTPVVVDRKEIQVEQVLVEGRVKDEKGQAIPFATVAVKGTTIGGLSDVDGAFKLNFEKPDGDIVLEISSMGYETVEVVYSGQKQVEVVLSELTQNVEEVVVVAYGTRKKGTISGSVATIKADKVEDVPAANFAQALQGSTPGLSVISPSGEPSKAPKFSIRGTNSINSGTSPLFILDGMQISETDFNAISPSDIESISVLKDASSTSIYGARAANGVVVITTKRGKFGERPHFTFRGQGGISQLSNKKWNMMNTAERIQYEKEIGLDAGQDYDKLAQTDVNWLEEVFNDAAPLQNYELSVSGASDKVNYFVSGGFFDQEGITTGSLFKRYNTRANVELMMTDKLKLGSNTMFAYEEIEQAEDGEYRVVTPISASRFMLPYWSPYQEDGSLASINDGTWQGFGENPLEWMKNNPVRNKKYTVISTLFMQYRVNDRLSLRSQLGLDYNNLNVFMQSMPSYIPNNHQGRAGRSASVARRLSVTNTANYKFDLENTHRFNFLLGQEGVSYRSEGFQAVTTGQMNDALSNVSSGTRAVSWTDYSTAYAYLSFFGRGEYSYQDKYYLDFSLRTDGSSRFGKGNRWGTFWSIGLMWDALGEDFFKGKQWLSKLQLAMSTGTSGNSSIPNFDHLALVKSTSDYYGYGGLAPVQRGNKNLGWEKLWSSNLALRMGFFSKLDLDIEFYNKRTTDMLMRVPQSYADGGYGYEWDNVGVMDNRGFEVTGAMAVVRNKKFQWTVNANVFYNKNELVELYAGVDEYVVGTTLQKYVVGHPVNEYFLNRYAGVNPNNGDALWYDKNGAVVSEIKESDKVMTGKSYKAPWQGGFGTDLSYQGFALSAQFSWMADRYLINNDRFFEESNGLFAVYNQSKRLLYDRWKQPGDVTDIPRHGVAPQFDTHLLEEASFLRLKNVMLSYTLSDVLLKKMSCFDQVRVYLQAQNLLTFTNFSGLDPETDSNLYQAQYPATRQFTFGLEIMF